MRPGPKTFSTSVFYLALPLLFLVFLAGCLPREKGQSQVYEYVHSPEQTARFNAFLALDEKQGPPIRLEVESIEILVKDTWLPLTTGPMTIDSIQIGRGQVFLGGMAVAPGQFKQLRLTITKGEMRGDSGKEAVVLTEPQTLELTLSKGLILNSGDSQTLLFSWDVENSLTPDRHLVPQLSVTASVRNLPVNLVFVTCPDINTVFVVRADKNWVVDSIGLTGQPTYLAIDPSVNRQRFYVLTPVEKMVKVVDMSSYRVIDSYPTLNDEATFMTINSSGDWAYLLHERTGYLSRMNLLTGQIENRAMVGPKPNFIAFLEQQNLLAVSLPLSQKVLLLDPESLRVVRTISTGSDPEGLIVSDNRLYIAESGSASILKYEMSNFSGQSRITVGFGPRRLVEVGNEIYTSNFKDGSLSVLLQGQLGVAQEIYGLGQPLEMIFDRFYRRLYVADERDAALTVIDTDSNQILGRVPLGAKPLGLAEIQ